MRGQILHATLSYERLDYLGPTLEAVMLFVFASDSQASLGSTDALCLFGTRTVV